MFSYGSGAASSLFLLRVNKNIDFMRKTMRIHEKLAQRIRISPEEYTRILQNKENNYGKPNIVPKVFINFI